ncbi:sodium/potassium-transporting ATPase subunit beta-1-like isoform X2 [Denticeps clupeoides]|nr:sodium/potassium-transporting ATPase subunit beta-1 isoform X2 [Denticeps clupeoides]
MMLTLSSYKPKYQDRVAPPGLSHTPRSEKGEIAFVVGDENSYKSIIKSMDDFLASYNQENQTDEMKFEDCGATPGDYKDRGDLERDTGIRKACRFQRTWLNKCSGLTDKSYGFNEGKPCLIVKLNRIVNYRPRAPKSSDDSQVSVNPFLLPIKCKNKRQEDEGKVGPVDYFGLDGGFPLQYYPYYGKLLQPHYLQPLVGIQFTNLTRDEELRIECTVFGDNIEYSEKDRYQGRFDVKFTLKTKS